MKKDSIAKQLKIPGTRMTKARRVILTIFSKHPAPLSAIDVLENLKQQQVNVNKTTVYRELSFLVNSEVIKEIHFGDSKVRYESTDEHHHHHVICDNCGKVDDLSLDESFLLKQIEKNTDFSIKRHNLEFFGICKECKV